MSSIIKDLVNSLNLFNKPVIYNRTLDNHKHDPNKHPVKPHVPFYIPPEPTYPLANDEEHYLYEIEALEKIKKEAIAKEQLRIDYESGTVAYTSVSPVAVVLMGVLSIMIGGALIIMFTGG